MKNEEDGDGRRVVCVNCGGEKIDGAITLEEAIAMPRAGNYTQQRGRSMVDEDGVRYCRQGHAMEGWKRGKIMQDGLRRAVPYCLVCNRERDRGLKQARKVF